MALGPELPEHMVLAYMRHQEMLEAAQQHRLLTQHQPPALPSRLRHYALWLRYHLGDLLIQLGTRLKAGPALASTTRWAKPF